MRSLRVALLASLSLAVAAIGPAEEPGGLLRQFERKLQSPDPAQRQRAIDVLADLLPPESAAPALVARLADDHPAVRASATAALVRLGAAAMPALLAALESDDGALRLEAVRTLGRLGTAIAGTTEPLAGMLADADPLVRAAALEGLAELGEQAAPHVDAIADHLLDEDANVQSAALQALSRLGVYPPTALPALNQLAETARDDDTRTLALEFAVAIESKSPRPVPVAEKVDYAPPPLYTPVEGISGTLVSVGTDEMDDSMTRWAEAFCELYPNATIRIAGKGSSTEPRALAAGGSDLGPMSRLMSATEEESFEKVQGHQPTALLVSLDVVAVVVHRGNPVESLSLPQVDAIFSSTRNLGYEQNVNRWSDLGVADFPGRDRVHPWSPGSASRAYAFFKERALGGGDFDEEMWFGGNIFCGDLSAITYTTREYITRNLRALPLAADADSLPVAPTLANVYSGAYPLTRQFYIYVNRRPGSELPPLQRE